MNVRYLLPALAGLLLTLAAIDTASGQTGQPHPLSPGAVVGTSVWDEQDKLTVGRRVELSTEAGRMLVHHAWTRIASRTTSSRNFAYCAYDIASGELSPTVQLVNAAVGGYLDLAVTGDNRAVIGGHHKYVTTMQPLVFWDSAAGAGAFTFSSRPPDSVQLYVIPRFKSFLWPRIAYVEGPTDTVLHLFAEMDKTDYEPIPMGYLRRIGSDRDPTAYWEYPPRLVDTTYSWAVHQISATDNGRVALAWTANVPCPGDPDTLSGTFCADSVEWDNDLYLQISNDYGMTWQPRRNITNYSADPDSRYRAHSEISSLFSESGELHVIWASVPWPRVLPAPGEITVSGGALFHWSEYSNSTSLIYDFGWNQTVCDGGTKPLNIADASIAECRGRLFVMFQQYNDPLQGIMNDCAVHPKYPHGAANPDLYLTVSSDGGICWDSPRNLTNSRTPGCDTIGGAGGPCAAESWPTMTQHGSNFFIDPSVSGAEIVVPSGGVDPGWYLDVQYIDDPSPDFYNYGNSYPQQTCVRWFRLACVDPILISDLIVTPDRISYPAFAPNCTERTVPIVLRNLGNGPAEYTITPEEQTGPSGWLASIGFTGSVAAGPSGCDTGYALINAGGAICSPGGITHLAGRLRFDSNSPTSPHYVAIDLVVADTVCPPSTDTLLTACLSLAVRNDGGCGARGTPHVGLDFANAGDCNPAASIYLEEASPVVACFDTPEATVAWSAYGSDYLSPHGLVPLESEATSAPGYNRYRALSADHDTSLLIETIWYAPTQPDSCRFLIQQMRLYSGDNAPHTVAWGHLIDWDIPSDSGVRNGSDTLGDLRLIYQSGAEYDQDPGACQDNDRRFGAVFPLGMYRLGSDLVPYSADSAHFWRAAQTRANSAWCSHSPGGLDPTETVAALSTIGWSLYQPLAPESTLVDLHTLVSYTADFLLQPGETLVVYTGFATVQNGDLTALRATAEQAHDWYCGHVTPDPAACSCCRVRGDANHDGKCIVSDLTYLVSFLFRGGVEPFCMEEADANNDGSVKISDVTFVVTFLFKGGATPPGC